MTVILLVALLVLWLMHQRLAARVAELQRQLGELYERGGAAAPAADPVASTKARPARIVRTPSPWAPPPLEPAEPEPPRDWIGQAASPDAEHAPAEPSAAESMSALFERLVGGRLLIWIGGIALAAAGVFLIRYSIEIGLITPPVRMIMAALFGLLLIGGGEFARSRPGAAPDPRVAQALVGAGLLVLYAAAYGSHVLYGLIGLRTAALLMIAATVAALFLSLRHGAGAAVLGLIGGFATPVLVGSGSETSIPLLIYLALLNLALFALSSRRDWTWLAASAVLLSFGWTAVLIFGAPSHALPAGVFIVAISIAASLVRAGTGWQLEFVRPAAIGLVQLALLVGRFDIGLPAWGLFGLLSLACFFLAGRRPEYRLLPALAFLLAMGLLGLKAIEPGAPFVAEVAVAITLLFAGGSLPAALRGEGRRSAILIASAAFAAPAILLRLARPELLSDPGWGAAFALLALGPLFLAWSRRGQAREEAGDAPLAFAAGTALLLLALAAVDLLPETLVGSAWFALALGAAWAARKLRDGGLAALAVVVGVLAATWAVLMLPRLWITVYGSLVGLPPLASNLPPLGRALVVLALPVPLLLLLWHVLRDRAGRWSAGPLALAGIFAAAAAYVLYKQIFALGTGADFARWGMVERVLLTQALFLAGWAVCTGRLPIPRLDEGQRWLLGLILTGIAAARLLLFDMALHNPTLTQQWVGPWPVANLIVPAYLLSAFWLYRARRSADSEARSSLWLALFLAALVFGSMLLVRQAFHGAILTAPEIFSAESYGYSLIALLLSIALLLGGIRLPDKALRVAGLALLTATISKVFLIDAAALEGVLRILSFLGLGIALIGISKLYTRVLNAEAGAAPAQA